MKEKKTVTKKKSRTSIYIREVTGILSSVLVGGRCQPALPKERMLQEPVLPTAAHRSSAGTPCP